MKKDNNTAWLTDKFIAELLSRRYLQKDNTGKVCETPDQLLERVAHNIAAVEKQYGGNEQTVHLWQRRFYSLMASLSFLPNSPTLMNTGRENGLLSACFVLPIPDSIDGIFNAVKLAALIQKAGGGTGFTFDQLRPTGDYVASSGGKTSGPISFWRVLSETTNAIQQGAFRRGANMGMMSITHPDILKFIHAKQNTDAFTNFNISVKVPNVFMQQVQSNPEQAHIVINKRTKRKYVIPRSVNIHNHTIDDLIPLEQVCDECYTVGDIWNLIITCAHATGEPGVAFIDQVNRDNPTPSLGQIEATNPCGEQPLLSYEACNLGSINISKLVNQSRSDIDWEKLAEIIKLVVRFLDDVIDANYYPIPEIKRITQGNRKIGLGIMGFTDALMLLGIRYDSEEAVELAEELASFITEHAHKASEDLANERGTFPNWNGSIWDTRHRRPIRNAAVTTIAPTGTISILAGCSSGIEPVFSLATQRIFDGRKFVHLHPLIEKLGTKDGWLNPEIRQQLLKGVSPTEILNFPKPLAEVLVTAHEIAPEWHVKIQAAFQKHIDNAVSKTVNIPADATISDVDKTYRLAFKSGCKGITVYRDNCRKNQVLASARTIRGTDVAVISPRPRSRKTDGQTTKFRMGCGTLFVCVNKDEQGLAEVFANLGKGGGCSAQTEATCRAISISLRSGVDPKILVEQLKDIRCLSTVARRKEDKDIDVLSCPDAIAKAIEEALDHSIVSSISTERSAGRACPFCRQPMRRDSGCFVCDKCLFSSCG